MYLIPEMIDIGLDNGQKFPSEAHKRVAEALAIGNPMVKDAETMTQIVQSVIKVPKNRIKTVTYDELRQEFDLPVVLPE